jgi:hypothetical protein
MIKDAKSVLSKELELLRNAIELAEKKAGQKQVNSPEVKKIIEIVESYLRRKKCICYGGTAINNLLPEEEQFYNKNIEIPDYDFFSPNALDDATELADIYYSQGYRDVDAKAGQHFGTYKVFVNFLPVADITYIDQTLFKKVLNDSIKVDGIYYAPPNFLRMSMYLELSRPLGDVSRWEKVFKRLQLLNKYYPLKGKKCEQMLFIDSFENDNKLNIDKHINNTEDNRNIDYHIYNTTKNSLITQGVVFFGGYAFSLYTKYINKKFIAPDFDVISENPNKTANILKEILETDGYKIKIKNRPSIGEIISPHVEVVVNKKPIAFIYEPSECNSYNIINIKGNNVKIATIDTMLAFYLAFLYGDDKIHDKNRILCMAEYLFRIQAKHKFKQDGVLKRFNINCYGQQSTKESIRAEKNILHEQLKDKRGTREYNEYFLDYKPYKLDQIIQKNNNIEYEAKMENHEKNEIENFKMKMKYNKNKKNITKKSNIKFNKKIQNKNKTKYTKYK